MCIRSPARNDFRTADRRVSVRGKRVETVASGELQ